MNLSFEVTLQLIQVLTTIGAIIAVISSTRSAISTLREKLTEISDAVKELGDKFTKLYIDVEILKARQAQELPKQPKTE